MNTDKILDDAREKIARFISEFRDWDGATQYIKDGWLHKASQILALSGTTDIECPDCMGQGSTDAINPVWCPRCSHSGSIPYKWKISVTLENGESMLAENYRQVVEWSQRKSLNLK